MLTRTLLTLLALICTGLATTSAAPASGSIDLRHQDGVDLMELQRGALQTAVLMVEQMKDYAEQAASPTATPAIRQALDFRFQTLKSQVGLLAWNTSLNGVYPLSAYAWYCVQKSPGSSDIVIAYGMDVGLPHLINSSANIGDQSSAASAAALAQVALEYYQAHLHANCSALNSLGASLDCGFIERYCRSEINSTGQEALLFGEGALLLGGGDLMSLSAFNCPPGELGWFLMAQSEASIPFGNGRLCMDNSSGPVLRISAATLIDSLGDVQFPLLETNYPFSSVIQPGSTWHFQFIFRDSNSTRWNATTALRVRIGS